MRKESTLPTKYQFLQPNSGYLTYPDGNTVFIFIGYGIGDVDHPQRMWDQPMRDPMGYYIYLNCRFN